MENDISLLVENWGTPNGINNDGDTIFDLNESTNKHGLSAGLYISGVFMQAEVVNRNRRLYPKKVLQEAVSRYIKEQVDTKQSLGELNHPDRATVDPMQAAIIIEKLWWEGNNVMGIAKIIEGDNGPGDKLAANVRAGWIPGVSSRGLGKLKNTSKGYSIVESGYRLTVGVDAVWGPSAPDALVQPYLVKESVEEPAIAEKRADNDEIFRKLAKKLKAL